VSVSDSGPKRLRREKLKSLVWLRDAKAATTWGVMMAIATLIGAIYLSQSSRIASVGREVQDLQKKLSEVKQENAKLEREIAESQTLERLRQSAIDLGFVKAAPEDVEYLVIQNFPSSSEVEEEVPEPTAKPEQIQSMNEALWLALRLGVGDLNRGESQ